MNAWNDMLSFQTIFNAPLDALTFSTSTTIVIPGVFCSLSSPRTNKNIINDRKTQNVNWIRNMTLNNVHAVSENDEESWSNEWRKIVANATKTISCWAYIAAWKNVFAIWLFYSVRCEYLVHMNKTFMIPEAVENPMQAWSHRHSSEYKKLFFSKWTWTVCWLLGLGAWNIVKKWNSNDSRKWIWKGNKIKK